ncbi:hypothetical protein ACLB2K_051309 [Fragaria x ananassa]
MAQDPSAPPMPPAMGGTSDDHGSFQGEKLEKKKALYFEKVQNKIAELHKEAEERRMMVQAAKKEECQKVEEMDEKYRATGHAPNNNISCFHP